MGLEELWLATAKVALTMYCKYIQELPQCNKSRHPDRLRQIASPQVIDLDRSFT